jgi:hypothetical protein
MDAFFIREKQAWPQCVLFVGMDVMLELRHSHVPYAYTVVSK